VAQGKDKEVVGNTIWNERGGRISGGFLEALSNWNREDYRLSPAQNLEAFPPLQVAASRLAAGQRCTEQRRPDLAHREVHHWRLNCT